MENAEYHKTLRPNAPAISQMRKMEIIEEIEVEGVLFDNESTINQLSVVLGQWVKENVPLEIERLANEAGHVFLQSPPCHLNLNAIELLSAYLKGRVVRNCGTGTTFRDVEERLRRQFSIIQSESGKEHILAIMEHCNLI